MNTKEQKWTLEDAMSAIEQDEYSVAELLQDPGFKATLRDSLALLVGTCHSAARQAGWWVDPKTGENIRDNPLCFSNKLALIHSEVSEAMEGDRKGLPDDKLPQYDMRCVELGDALIRICDTAGGFGMSLADATVDKMIFNTVRPDHKLAARAADKGKAY